MTGFDAWQLCIDKERERVTIPDDVKAEAVEPATKYLYDPTCASCVNGVSHHPPPAEQAAIERATIERCTDAVIASTMPRQIVAEVLEILLPLLPEGGDT